MPNPDDPDGVEGLMTVPIRRTIQQAQHKVEAAISVLMSGEDSCYAVDDLRSARDQLKQLEEALVKEAREKQALRAP